jgi:hypothetical protein
MKGKEETVRFRVSQEERALIERLAGNEGESMSVVIRRLIKQAANWPQPMSPRDRQRSQTSERAA